MRPELCHARVFLDSASLRGMTEPPHQVRNDIVVGISLKLVLWNAPEYALCSAAIPPPLSGREEASRPRPEGEDCLSAASSAAPEGGASLRAMKPDNSGGASWFVLLAAEKNEHVVSPALDAGSRSWEDWSILLRRLLFGLIDNITFVR